MTGVLLLSRPTEALSSNGPRFGGRFGLEVDGAGEEYRAPGLFDERLLSDGTLEVQLEDRPIRDRQAALLGMLDLRFDTGELDRRWLTLENRARLGRDRRRNSSRVETGLSQGPNLGRVEGEWDWQGGDDNPASGTRTGLTGVYERDSLPFDLDLQTRIAGEWSEADTDSLAALFDYRSVRGQGQIHRMLGSRFDARAVGGMQRRIATHSSTGSFRGHHGEASLSGFLRSSDRLETLIRYEMRRYDSDSLGIPSSASWEGSVRYEARLSPAVKPFAEQTAEWQDYVRSSAVFQDHHHLRSEAGVDWSLGGDVEVRDKGVRLRTSAVGEWFRSDTMEQDSLTFSTNFDTVGGLVGLASEGVGNLWFDFSLSVGMRNYLATPASQLTYEGWNFSLSASDFLYVRLSGFLQWSPVPWLRQDLFFQWDEEIHDPRTDDFRLWIVNLAVTHPFD